MINEYKVKQLLDKGVKVPAPDSIEIGDDVDTKRISGTGVTIHSGCRIFGSSTFISDGCVIGRQGPATIENCWLAPDVHVNGGYVKSSVFLNKVTIGYGAQIREGTILEEEASVAHTVGLKQTVLFPFVTLGSLINFCDCFMSGGTSRKNHSEVGSSYIHFNYTPNQDKATASLLGDVPKGVMLNNKPIFLGGQGGLVGPVRLNYGTVIAAGTIQRKDQLEPDRLLFGGALRPGNIKHTPGLYQNVNRMVDHNVYYIANLIALMNWYHHVRSRCVSERFPLPLIQGLTWTLSQCIQERLKRLKDFLNKASESSFPQSDINWERVELEINRLAEPEPCGSIEKRDIFLRHFDLHLKDNADKDYVALIQSLDTETSLSGTAWLADVVEHVHEYILGMIKKQ